MNKYVYCMDICKQYAHMCYICVYMYNRYICITNMSITYVHNSASQVCTITFFKALRKQENHSETLKPKVRLYDSENQQRIVSKEKNIINCKRNKQNPTSQRKKYH